MNPIPLESQGQIIFLETDDEVASQEGGEPVRVLIADDHPLVREGIKRALEHQGFSICAEASDAESAVHAALAESPDVCVVGFQLPDGGIRAMTRINQELPETVVLMITISENESDLLDSLRAGAAGFISKETPPEALPKMIRATLRGESAVPRHLVRTVLDALLRTQRKSLPLSDGKTVTLTPREWDVLELLDDGLTTKEIAARLAVSPITIRRHIATLLKKLRVPDRSAALRLFQMHDQMGS